jgi:hypothetical protein
MRDRLLKSGMTVFFLICRYNVKPILGSYRGRRGYKSARRADSVIVATATTAESFSPYSMLDVRFFSFLPTNWEKDLNFKLSILHIATS